MSDIHIDERYMKLFLTIRELRTKNVFVVAWNTKNVTKRIIRKLRLPQHRTDYFWKNIQDSKAIR